MAASRKPFTRFTLDNPWVVEFPTRPAGVLRLAPGPVVLDARFVERERDAEGWHAVVGCDLRLADAEGRVWQASHAFSSLELLYPLIDLSRPESGRWLRNAPAAWRKALKRPMLGGVPATYDDRFHRYVWLDDTFFFLRFKYLGAAFAIAAGSASTLLVQVGGLFGSWNPLRVRGPDGAPLPTGPPLTPEERDEQDERDQVSGAAGDLDNLAPLVYEIDAGRLLFPPSRVPLVFSRHKGKAEPQPLVTAQAGARPTADQDDDGEDGFQAVALRYCDPWQAATDAGGYLVVEGYEPLRVRLDRHPASAALPFDVLRCRTRLTDAAGDVWQATTHFTADFFVEKIVNLDSASLTVFDEPPGAGTFAAGLRGVLDDGAWRYLLVGADDLVAFKGENQRVVFDVDLPDRYDHVSVRLCGLVGRRRPVEVEAESEYCALDPEGREAERAAWERDGPLPPLRFEVALFDLLFRNTTFAVDDGFWHHSPIPIPVIFTRVGTAEPGDSVRFVADA